MKKILKYISIPIITLALVIGYIIEIDGNFHKLDDNAYRSGQLNEYNLKYYIKKYKIKTILNLRGESSRKWYAMEKNISKQYNVKHIDYGISNSQYYTYSQLKPIEEIIKKSQKPILIHCEGGADRTSLVSAIYIYIYRKSLFESLEEFNPLYGYMPYFRPQVKVMKKSFLNYVSKTQNPEFLYIH